MQEELNLIASLALLDDFNVSMLPVQVRLCDNKLDIVRNILDSAPSAYKKHEKVGKGYIHLSVCQAVVSVHIFVRVCVCAVCVCVCVLLDHAPVSIIRG